MDSKFSLDFKNGLASVTLSGRLDAASAPLLQEEFKKLNGSPVSNLVFFANNLEYISSAGLRVIIFAKQKIGGEAKVYLIGGSDSIKSVIKMSGLDNFMIMQETYP